MASSLTVDVQSSLAVEKLWETVVGNSHVLLPQAVPELVAAVAVKGPLAVGSEREVVFTPVLAHVGKVCERITKIDVGGREFEYEVVEGGELGTVWSKAVFSLKISAAADSGGSVATLTFCYEAVSGVENVEANAKQALDFNAMCLAKLAEQA